jgi:hypothetical protein
LALTAISASKNRLQTSSLEDKVTHEGLSSTNSIVMWGWFACSSDEKLQHFEPVKTSEKQAANSQSV